MKAGHYPEACPKLEAARKLYTSAGIFLNLADCHEKIGRVASAWTEFGEAAAVAKRTNRDDDAEEATRRQAALEPSLPRLTLRGGARGPGPRRQARWRANRAGRLGGRAPRQSGRARDPGRGGGVRALDRLRHRLDAGAGGHGRHPRIAADARRDRTGRRPGEAGAGDGGAERDVASGQASFPGRSSAAGGPWPLAASSSC